MRAFLSVEQTMYQESEDERLVELNAQWEERTRQEWAKGRGFKDYADWENYRDRRRANRSWCTEEDLM